MPRLTDDTDFPLDAALTGAEKVVFVEGTDIKKATLDDVGEHVASRLGVFNVLDYGAVGDGVTDDTAAIQAAITAGSGKTVVAPAATYLVNVSTGLDVPSNTTIDLSQGATLKAAAAPAGVSHRILHLSGVDNVRIVGGTLLGSRSTDTGDSSGIRCVNSNDIWIESLTVKDFSLDGLYIGEDGGAGSECERIHVVNCKATNNARQGMSVTGVIGMTITGGDYSSTGTDAPGAGIDIEPNAPAVARDVRISGVRCVSNSGPGILVFGATASHVTILNCVAKLNGINGIRLGRSSDNAVIGCTITGNTGTGVLVNADNSAADRANRNRIIGNLIESNTGDGVLIESLSTAEAHECTVANNSIRSNGGAGVLLNRTARGRCVGNLIASNTSHGINVNSTEAIGNVLESNTIKGNDRGISLFQSNNTIVANNSIVENLTMGVRVNGASDCVITGNFLRANSQAAHNTSDNIILEGSADDNNIQGNTCRQGALANKPRYGINVSAATCDTNVVTNNDLKTGGATGALNNVGTGTVTTAGNRT